MIQVTKLNGSPMFLNSELIETIESTPDTMITITNGKKFVVRESVDEIVQRTVDFKRLILYKYAPSQK